jgi:acetyltransferase
VATCAAGLGQPVAVKIASSAIVHKSDVDAVVLDLATPQAAEAAARRMLDRLRAQGLADRLDGFVVQEMVEGPGAELFVGVVSDPMVGPLVACGTGGTLVELMDDVSVRITPITDRNVTEMVRSLKAYGLPRGYRGTSELDVAALEELVERIGVLVEDLPVRELDCKPVYVTGQGCIVLDAPISLAAPVPRGRVGPGSTRRRCQRTRIRLR